MTELLCGGGSFDTACAVYRGLLTRCAADYVRCDGISCRRLSDLGIWLGGGLRDGGVGGWGGVWTGGDDSGPHDGLFVDSLLAGSKERHGKRRCCGGELNVVAAVEQST